MGLRIGEVGAFRGYVFVVVVAFVDSGFVLCRHRDRSTWETPGGHIEAGESPLEAARRELLEEAGLQARSLFAIADYQVDGVAGQLFTAETGTRRPQPGFEMVQALAFDRLPDNLTYPEITPALVAAAILERESAAGSAG